MNYKLNVRRPTTYGITHQLADWKFHESTLRGKYMKEKKNVIMSLYLMSNDCLCSLCDHT